MRDPEQWKCATASSIGATLLIILLLASQPAAAQNGAGSGRTFCTGCSVDGKTTPRMADGHPDLSGYWGGGAAPIPGAPAAPAAASTTVFQRAPDRSILFELGTETADTTLKICPPLDQSCQVSNQPPYNEKYMAKVQEIAKTEFGGATPLDPIQDCRPAGLPRAGIPQHIVQTPQVIVFLYNAVPYSTYRMIYTDGRPHPDMKEYETTYFGDSIGHWEGDTLVVDTIGFNDDTWLGGDTVRGTAQFTSIHSEKEHVIERLARDGNVLSYDVTVEDPEALTKPWVLPTRRILHSGPGLEVPTEDALVEMICQPSEYFVKPDPEDVNIKTRCGFRCDK